MTKFWGPCFPKGQNFRRTIRQVKIAAEPSDNTTGPGAAFRGSNQLRYPQCSRKLYAPAVEKFGIVNTLAPIRQTILFYGWPHPIWGVSFGVDPWRCGPYRPDTKYYNVFDHNISMWWSHFDNFAAFTVSMTLNTSLTGHRMSLTLAPIKSMCPCDFLSGM